MIEAPRNSRGQYSSVDAVQDEDADSMVNPGSSSLSQLPLRLSWTKLYLHALAEGPVAPLREKCTHRGGDEKV